MCAHLYTSECVHLDIHACGGQRITPGVDPQGILPFFETNPFIGLESHWEGCSGPLFSILPTKDYKYSSLFLG